MSGNDISLTEEDFLRASLALEKVLDQHHQYLNTPDVDMVTSTAILMKLVASDGVRNNQVFEKPPIDVRDSSINNIELSAIFNQNSKLH